MDTPKWFSRQFDFTLRAEDYPAIYNRLQSTMQQLEKMVLPIHEEALSNRTGDKWSVKEHIGHLTVLESLWQVRFQEIRKEIPVMTAADLDNKATFEGHFNEISLPSLLEKFRKERNSTLLILDSFNASDMTKTSLHPRLQQPMRVIDHAYFIAEHDDHHFAVINGIIKNSKV